ncbi:dihydroneopterin aldolase|uniref:7,8-dihydroneopterin aldolase n=1 Tax=Dendrosporobacter quercicolus TaxID=146817 RepID=A0A1G9MLM3_9FIRM|nr:dihydroneopterin aldolase [Dendrosporobacter quercicolus]NSL47077.1 dihydroneopterin aldolase [Dendrosporobacter quercicolus DSM 1736]SDL75170.1 dihydroneopterin aldolase [Dendrosporobacter quercicolus]
MADKILLKNMMFYGFHGVFEYEREQGQRFYIDVELTADFDQAGKTDNLEDTIDYTAIYSHIKEIAETQRFQLLEALASQLCDSILAAYDRLQAITVRIRKPAVPIPGQIDFVQVEIARSR